MYKILLVIFASFSLTYSSTAQETWTLQMCIKEALENSLEVEQTRLARGVGLEEASISLTQAKHNRYPTLSANTNLGTNFGRFVNPITDAFINQSFFSNSVGLNTGVPLYNGFRITNSLKAAKIDLEASMLDVSQVERDISLTVANTYLGVLFAEENIKVAQSRLDNTQNQIDQLNKLISAGSRPANALFELEAQFAANEQELIMAENSGVVSMLNLKQLMRMEPVIEITVIKPAGVDVLSNVDELSFEEVYNSAYNNQPSVQAAKLRQKSAELGVKIAKGGLMPSINMGGGIQSNYGVILNLPDGAPAQKGYGDQLNENLSYNIGIGVSMPIYQNYENQLNVQRAKVNVKRIDNQNAQLENRLMVTVQQALTDAKAARRKLTAADKTVLAQEAALQNAKKGYELGATNSFEYITIENNAAQAKVNALIAKYEYLFAMKVLDFYMGNPINLD